MNYIKKEVGVCQQFGWKFIKILIADWELAVSGETPYKIESLK